MGCFDSFCTDLVKIFIYSLFLLFFGLAVQYKYYCNYYYYYHYYYLLSIYRRPMFKSEGYLRGHRFAICCATIFFRSNLVIRPGLQTVPWHFGPQVPQDSKRRWRCVCHWIGFVGKILTGNPWVFTCFYHQI